MSKYNQCDQHLVCVKADDNVLGGHLGIFLIVYRELILFGEKHDMQYRPANPDYRPSNNIYATMQDDTSFY